MPCIYANVSGLLRNYRFCVISKCLFASHLGSRRKKAKVTDDQQTDRLMYRAFSKYCTVYQVIFKEESVCRDNYIAESEIRYLGVFITAGHRFSCSLSNAKRSFYRKFNSIFSKVGRVASENTANELLKPRLHDTTCCYTGCQTGLTTG